MYLIKSYRWSKVVSLTALLLTLSVKVPSLAQPPDKSLAAPRDGQPAVAATVVLRVATTACGKFDLDDLWDLAVGRAGEGLVDIYFGLGDNEFVWSAQIGVGEPSDLVASDVDGDGRTDLVVADVETMSVLVVGNDGAGGFEITQEVQLDYAPAAITAEQAYAVLCNVVVFDVTGEPRSVLVNDGLGVFTAVPLEDWTGGLRSPAEECGSEPDCSPTPGDPGIQACMEATWCRFQRCAWADCMQYESGEYGYVRHVGAKLACDLIWDAETIGCVPAGIVGDLKDLVKE